MALDVYYRSDVAQQITSTLISMLTTAQAHGGGNVEYLRGAWDFARAQAVSYGIAWSGLVDELRAVLEDDARAVLDGLYCSTLEG